MKATPILGTLVPLSIVLFITLALTNFNPPAVSAQSPGVTSVLVQTTPTPPADGVSEIGSTDGILFMGVVIVLIVTLPLLFHKSRR
ncbi:MAG: hypothetical protein QY332_20585 [Anaerolineales bacterium]|nr:MAG: hypothetical protein QY332_20585 [Anaerolineales bacterium]